MNEWIYVHFVSPSLFVSHSLITLNENKKKMKGLIISTYCIRDIVKEIPYLSFSYCLFNVLIWNFVFSYSGFVFLLSTKSFTNDFHYHEAPNYFPCTSLHGRTNFKNSKLETANPRIKNSKPKSSSIVMHRELSFIILRIPFPTKACY